MPKNYWKKLHTILERPQELWKKPTKILGVSLELNDSADCNGGFLKGSAIAFIIIYILNSENYCALCSSHKILCGGIQYDQARGSK